jgi:hypothetical protein
MIVANGKVLVVATIPKILSKLTLGIHVTLKKDMIIN